MQLVALPANKHLSILRQRAANGVRTVLVYDGTPGNGRVFIQLGQTALTRASGGGAQDDLILKGPKIQQNWPDKRR
jgi:hypothetical protein